MLVVDGKMLYRPLLRLSLLRSQFTTKHLTMNSLPMHRSDGVRIFFFLSFYVECMLFVGWSIGQTVILGVKEKNIAHNFYLFLFLLADVVMLVIIYVHRRSSILSFRSKVMVVMPFFPLSSRLCSVSSLAFFFSLSFSRPFVLISWEEY